MMKRSLARFSRIYSRRYLSSAPQFALDRLVAVAKDGDKFTTTVSSKFNVTVYPNGGAVQLAMIRAAIESFEGRYPDPLVTSVTFLQPPLADEEHSIEVDTIKSGRSTANLTVRLLSRKGEVARMIATLGDLSQGPMPGVSASLNAEPSIVRQLPYPEACVGLHKAYPFFSETDGPPQAGVPQFPIAGRTRVLVDPAFAAASAAEPPLVDVQAGAFTETGAGHFDSVLPEASGRRPEYACHVSLEPEPELGGRSRPIDAQSLAFILDGLPPPVMLLCLPKFTWVPTLQLHTHFRARPREGTERVRVYHRSERLSDGMVGTDCDAFDDGGRLLATSRYLAMMMPAKKRD